MQKAAGIRRSQSEPSGKGAKRNDLFGAPFRRIQSLHTAERLEKLDLTSSSSSLRAKVKAEEEEVEEMTRSLQEVQKYLKELETFLDRHDEAQLEKRKWQHLNWTYDVWLPLQKRVKQHLSRSRYMRERQRAYRACADDSENRRYYRRCCVAGCKYNPSQSSHPVNKPAISDTSSSTPRLDRRSGRRFFTCL